MRIFTIVLLLALAPIFGQAQNTISGKIVDELGLPLYLASVSIENSDTTVYTDNDGSFTLSSSKDFHWQIQISAAGYETESFFVLSGGNTGELILRYGAELRDLLVGEEFPPNEEKAKDPEP